MFPYRDENPGILTPVVTGTIVALFRDPVLLARHRRAARLA